MIWKKITKQVLPPENGVQEAIDNFYNVDGDANLSLSALADIKEWAHDPDDVIIAIKVYNNSIYIFQMFTGGSVLKILSPNHTYVYKLIYYHTFEFSGAFTPYSVFEVLDENTVLYGNLYFDLTNLIVFILDKPIENDAAWFKVRGILPTQKSIKKINNTSWIRFDTLADKMFKQRITLFQKTSFLNCLSCKDRKRVFEALGAYSREKTVACKEETLGNVTIASYSGTDNKKIKTSQLKALSDSQGMSSNGDSLNVEYDITACLENFKKLTAVLNRKNFSTEATDYFSSLSQNCNPKILSSLVDYIVSYYKAHNLHTDFVRDYYGNEKIDYDAFFKEAEDISKSVIKTISGIVYGMGDTVSSLKALREIFSDPYLWGVLYFKVYKQDYIKRYKDSKSGEWQTFNPYADLTKVDFDSFYSTVVQVLTANVIEKEFPFPIRKIKVSKTKNFSEDAVYYSLGPAGCLSVIEFELLPQDSLNVVCDVEIRGDDEIFVWGWVDVNGLANKENNYLVNTYHPPKYKIKIYKLIPSKKKSILMYEEDIPDGWHMLDHRKMAVAMDDSKSNLYFRDYYISEYKNGAIEKVSYIETKKPLSNGMSTLLRTVRAIRVSSNINNVMWNEGGRINFSVSPGFPNMMVGPKDLDDNLLRIMMPY